MSEKSEMWDKAAKDFQRTYELGENDYIRRYFRFLEEKNMIFPGCRVIDVGCGVGKYGKLLAERGCDVTLTDISAEMLKYAKDNLKTVDAPHRIFQADFDDVDIEDDAFYPRFDLCISTMSPAIHDKKTISKFSDISSKWCFVAGFTESDEAVRKDVLSHIGFDWEEFRRRVSSHAAHTTMQDIKEMTEELGYTPSMDIVPYVWNDRRTPEEFADLIHDRFLSVLDRPEEEKIKALEYIETLKDSDGLIDDTVYTSVAWVYWRADQRKA